MIKERFHIKWALVFYDLIVYLIVDYVFLLRYDEYNMVPQKDAYMHMLLACCCIYVCRYFMRVYHQIWRYGGVQIYIRLIVADMMAAAIYCVAIYLTPIGAIPRSRMISIVSCCCLGSLIMRMVYRYAYKCANTDEVSGRILNYLLLMFTHGKVSAMERNEDQKIKIAIVGAGRVGALLAEELIDNPKASYLPVCFVEIKANKVGREIRGIPVIIEEEGVTLARLKRYDVQEIVIALPNATSEHKKELYTLYSKAGYKVKVYDYPGMQNAGKGKRSLRAFDVEEVLFRNPIQVTGRETRHYYHGKVILITGGGGSIGSEIARQIAKMRPKQLILLDVYENGVYDLVQDIRMTEETPIDVKIEIMSITNKKAMARVFETYHPEIVINAAAHKHVPLMEHNCIEAIENNVFGTLNVVELCEEYGTERFMMLSTDKAVNPTNVMGATKRMCEMIIQAYSTVGRVKYSATRFGNVLGSAGSVIPLFRKQIEKGGPVTITDFRIIRYFMTIPEASQLVLESGAMAKNGELFVLDMGEPVKILDLAETMIHLMGYEAGRDIKIIETGLRPGEKLYEELLVKSEDLDKTQNELIFIERDKPITMEELLNKLAILRCGCESGDDQTAKDALRHVVPTFYKPEEINRQINKD